MVNQAEQDEPDIQAIMLAEYGPLLGGKELRNALGYSSPAAFWQARRRGNILVRTFRIEGRRGTFALTTDVARWLRDTASSCSADHAGPVSTVKEATDG